MPVDAGVMTPVLTWPAETPIAARRVIRWRPPSSLGEALRGRREAQGLDLEDLSPRHPGPAAYLAAIEAMRLDELPSRPFTIGYIRAYAEALGLDAEAGGRALQGRGAGPRRAAARAGRRRPTTAIRGVDGHRRRRRGHAGRDHPVEHRPARDDRQRARPPPTASRQATAQALAAPKPGAGRARRAPAARRWNPPRPPPYETPGLPPTPAPTPRPRPAAASGPRRRRARRPSALSPVFVANGKIYGAPPASPRRSPCRR